MLQFGGTLYNVTIRRTSRSTLRQIASTTKNLNSSKSGTQPALEKQDSNESEKQNVQTDVPNKDRYQANQRQNLRNIIHILKSNATIATNTQTTTGTSIPAMIRSAESVDDILNLSISNKLNATHAANIFSIITSWINKGKIKYSDIENDERFKNLKRQMSSPKMEFNLLEYNLLQDDLVNEFEKRQLSTNVMVQIMGELAAQNKRHVPLLRSLSDKLSESKELFSIKHAADTMYAMAVLNFSHIALLQKVSRDLLITIPRNQNGPIIGSILTSLGLIRYKDVSILDAICSWIIEKNTLLRTQDMCSLMQTCATVAYTSPKLDSIIENHIKPLKISNMSGIFEWLDLVWSMVVLERADNSHFSSVLDRNFIDQMSGRTNIHTIAKQLKLLNTNAAAKYIAKNYTGPYLNEKSNLFNLRMKTAKDKRYLLDLLSETLLNTFPSANYFNTNVNTEMGFHLDAECHLNKKNQPLPIGSSKESSIVRIAIMLRDYHSYCINKDDLLGLPLLQNKILTMKGYHVVNVSYKNFSQEHNLMKRVKFLNEEIYSIAENVQAT